MSDHKSTNTISEETVKEWLEQMKVKLDDEDSADNAQVRLLEDKLENITASTFIRVWLSWIIFSAPIALLLILAFFLKEYVHFFLSGIVVWITVYFVWGVRVYAGMNEHIIERFGQYVATKKAGLRLLCLPNLIDKEVKTISIQLMKLDLYKSEGDHKMDFTNASAPIRAQVWYRVADSRKWYYSVDNPESRMEERFDALARPLMQRFDIDSAQIHKSHVCQWIAEQLNPKMNDLFGADTEKMFITDIVLPPEVIEARQKILLGSKEGSQHSYAIQAIMNDLGLTGKEGREEAAKIYYQQSGLKAIKETGANVSLVGDNAQSVVKMLDVTGKNGDKS